MKVLVADDDPTTRTLLRRLLIRDFDCEVTEAMNGLETLAQLDKQRFSVLLLDVHMPVMGGLETLKAIRASSQASLPVVMMTAERGEAVVKQAAALGVTDYLTKPLRPNRTGERLARVLHSLGSADLGAETAEAAAVTSDERLYVLVVEGDADYRHFLMDFFKPRCEALQATSGAEALIQCSRAAPRLVFAGGDLGIIDCDQLARKIRATSSLSGTRVIAIVARSLVADVQASGLYAGVIARSFVPEILRDQFERLIASSAAPVEALERLHPRFRMSLITATEQVFGMALSAQVELIPEPEPAAGDRLVATIRLTAAEQKMAVDVTLRLQDDVADALTRRMAGFEEVEVVTAEDRTATVGELVNMVVGRVQNALAQRGLPAEVGVPEAGARTTGGGADDDTGMVLSFKTDDGLGFELVALAIETVGVAAEA